MRIITRDSIFYFVAPAVFCLAFSYGLLQLRAKFGLYHLGPDTIEYLEAASYYLAGNFFSPVEGAPLGAVERVAGFPLLLAAASAIFGLPAHEAIVPLHALLYSLAAGILTTSLRNTAHPVVVYAALLSLGLGSYSYSLSIGTEFSAACLGVILLAAITRFFVRPSVLQATLSVAIAAVLALLRPEFIISAVSLVFFLMLFASKGSRIKMLIAAVAGLLPILLLVGINCVRLDSCSLAPTTGKLLASYAVCFLDEGQTDQLGQSAEFSMEFTKSASRVSSPPVENPYNRGPLIRSVLTNFYLLRDILQELAVQPVAGNHIALEFALDATRIVTGAYLFSVFEQIAKAIGIGLFLIVPLLLLYLLIQEEAVKRIALAGAVCTGCFSLNLAAASFVTPIQPRHDFVLLFVGITTLLIVSWKWLLQLIEDTPQQ